MPLAVSEESVNAIQHVTRGFSQRELSKAYAGQSPMELFVGILKGWPRFFGYGQPILTGIRLADNRLILMGAIPAAVLAILIQS